MNNLARTLALLPNCLMTHFIRNIYQIFLTSQVCIVPVSSLNCVKLITFFVNGGWNFWNEIIFFP